MDLYMPYVAQATALVLYCACMLLVAAGRVRTCASVVLMFAGSVSMAMSCLLAGNVVAALSCAWIVLCVQLIPLLATSQLDDDGRLCATLLADAVQVTLTMSMVAETTYGGAYACDHAFKLATALAALVLVASVFSRQVGAALGADGGRRALVLTAMLTVIVMLHSFDRSFVTLLPGWGSVSWTDFTVSCGIVTLGACSALYACPADGDSALSRLAAPVSMLPAACCMTYLGDAAAGIGIAVAMAAVMASSGRRASTIAVSLIVSVASALALSLVVPNMANAWRIWSGGMEGVFSGVDQAKTTAALFSTDSLLLGCGVGRWTEAMWCAPHSVAWPLMMSCSTFGFQGAATFAVAGLCVMVTGIRTLLRRRGGAALPFLCVCSSVVLLLGLAATFGVLPDLENGGPMFLCMDVSTSVPLFQAVAIAVALSYDLVYARASEDGVRGESAPEDEEMPVLLSSGFGAK
ncbi:MAG: hypothetical protein J6D54_09205 [Olsenella sp.]|nr:hypothetical protein [Olsenella sp.]